MASKRDNWVHASIGYHSKKDALAAKSRLARVERRRLKVVKAGGYWVVQALQPRLSRNPTARIPAKWTPARVTRLKSGQIQLRIGRR